VAVSLNNKIRLVAVLPAIFAAVVALAATPVHAQGPGSQARGGTWIYSPEPVGPWEPLPVHRSQGTPERAAVKLTRNEIRIPPSFFGLAIEYDELAAYEAEGPLFDRVLSLLRPQDASPATTCTGIRTRATPRRGCSVSTIGGWGSLRRSFDATACT
jgi:hypothetical protein